MMKKGGLTIKVPISQIGTDVKDKVLNHLLENPDYAFTIAGLMVEIFRYKAEDLNASFKDWPKGAPSLYTRIGFALKDVKKSGVVNSKKEGKKFLYWLVKEELKKKG